jgi:hypothetical protein
MVERMSAATTRRTNPTEISTHQSFLRRRLR